jgi:hypothetical protein
MGEDAYIGRGNNAHKLILILCIFCIIYITYNMSTTNTPEETECLPALLGRNNSQYITNHDELTYAGKLARSEQSSEKEHNVERVSVGMTLCSRECLDNNEEGYDKVIDRITRTMIDEIISEVEKTSISYPECTTTSEPICAAEPWSLFRCIFGYPCKCDLFDTAEITTMEPKYFIHPKIGEFWCFITSFFYGSSLLLYLVKEEDWFEGWREAAGWPAYIHFSIAMSLLVMILSAVYHASIIEIAGCMDCFFASFIFASVCMSMFGVDMTAQVCVLLGIGLLNLNAWRYSTQLTLIIVAIVYPFAMYSCMLMKSYYGLAVFLLVNLGMVCFLLDRLGIAPLHSLWHIFGAGAITLALYHVVVNGTVVLTNVFGCGGCESIK